MTYCYFERVTDDYSQIVSQNEQCYAIIGIAGLVVWYLASGGQGPRITTLG